RPAIRPKAAQHLEPVDFRQHEIENHEIGRVLSQPLQRQLSVRSPVNVVSFEFETGAQSEGECFAILYYEHRVVVMIVRLRFCHCDYSAVQRGRNTEIRAPVSAPCWISTRPCIC